ncbi:hypothetical protein Mal64_32990 [Pseudobythopirellula maris]|uniref:Uncharacterized protein n=1 Tax=Pseudobythopirellula maris TaxID=2527991 RepID=A0A5C5ZGM8_9BACT|nr:hypothetical protein [Pseudobythopirellula maris]TWT86474.1 hypothetical protein Mal64_32990 [Pseudobythopirellula maris]
MLASPRLRLFTGSDLPAPNPRRLADSPFANDTTHDPSGLARAARMAIARGRHALSAQRDASSHSTGSADESVLASRALVSRAMAASRPSGCRQADSPLPPVLRVVSQTSRGCGGVSAPQRRRCAESWCKGRDPLALERAAIGNEEAARLVAVQMADGGWGRAPGARSTLAETAAALLALSAWLPSAGTQETGPALRLVNRD